MSTTARTSHAPAESAAPESDPAAPALAPERGTPPSGDFCTADAPTRRTTARPADQHRSGERDSATTESGGAELDTASPGHGIARAAADTTATIAGGRTGLPLHPVDGFVGNRAVAPPECGVRPGLPLPVPAVRLRDARLSYGERTLWEGLDLEVAAGEFIAVLGPNGSGKTSLLRMLLGQLSPTAGAVEVAGAPARVGNPHIGYVPQQKTIDSGVPLRGVDLVGLGVDGHRWGLGWRGRKDRKQRVADAIAQVGAGHYAHAPLESMSGGEQQRLRVAQALVGDPRVLLCDEPLLSLDMANQRLVAELIDARRRSHDTAVMFVTHEINPVLPLVDRVLYLVDGEFRIGTPDEVMTSEVLSELYRTEVDVLRVRRRLVVVGTGDAMEATS